jgi:hypothetical protein
MKKNIYILSFLAVFICLAFADPNDDDTIFWSLQHKLTWKNFKGKPGTVTNEQAFIRCGLTYSVNAINGEFSVTINGSCTASTSWAIDTTEELLSHEQGHFDLSEIYARKMRQATKGLSLNRDSIYKQMNVVYKQYSKLLKGEERSYDSITQYSHNLLEQKKWDIKIDSTLRALDAYRNSVIAVSLVK